MPLKERERERDKRVNNIIVDRKRGMVRIISVSEEPECEEEIEQGIKRTEGERNRVCMYVRKRMRSSQSPV